MSGMFSNTIFNKPIGNWDTKNVTNMSGMFSYSDFNQDINKWVTSKVTDMSAMFYSAKSFNCEIMLSSDNVMG